MDVIKREVKARVRPFAFGFSVVSDFELGDAVAMDAVEVLSNPLISLYCLDHANRSAIFVETPAEVDLSAAPFFYLAQYENAQSVISVPYETLVKLAEMVTLDSSRLILVHSVGRSGSTLVGAALNAIPGVVGISEPDAISQLVGVRGFDGLNEQEAGDLLVACLKLQCKPTANNPKPAAWAIKFRSFCIELADLLQERFPHTRNIYLYRNAISYVNSALRAFVPLGMDFEDERYRAYMHTMLSSSVPSIAKYVKTGGPLLGSATLTAMTWVRSMQCYLQMVDKGVSSMAVRYEDLKTSPREAARAIVVYCGFPEVEMESVYRVLEKDSQAGSLMARETLASESRQLSDAQKDDVRRVLAEDAVVKTPEFVAPGTWTRP